MLLKFIKVKKRINKKKHGTLYYLITSVGLIMVWRGVWGLSDVYLFPGDYLLSHLASLLIGFAIVYFNDFSLSELE